jgi:hypothetical protein
LTPVLGINVFSIRLTGTIGCSHDGLGACTNDAEDDSSHDAAVMGYSLALRLAAFVI